LRIAVADDAIRVLPADTVIQVGGWHPKYARVLLIEHDGDHAHGRWLVAAVLTVWLG